MLEKQQCRAGCVNPCERNMLHVMAASCGKPLAGKGKAAALAESPGSCASKADEKSTKVPFTRPGMTGSEWSGRSRFQDQQR
jgi:hypothetical protein